MELGNGSRCAFTVRMDEQPDSHDRHLTSEQRENISAHLQGSTTGPVLLTAVASDKEAVCYQGEIASVLEDVGCEVKIDNAKEKASVPEIPKGVEMTIKERTVRPIHAHRIIGAFRRAGVAIAARINARRRKNNTVYIAVGPNDGQTPTPQTIRPALLEKWRLKFAQGWFR